MFKTKDLPALFNAMQPVIDRYRADLLCEIANDANRASGDGVGLDGFAERLRAQARDLLDGNVAR